MKRLKRLSDFISKLGLYGLFFCIILFSFSLVNAKKVVNFWINDETDYNEWSVDLGSKGETDYISNFWCKIQFVNLNGLIRNIFGQHEMNGIVKLNNGYLMTTYEYEADENLQSKADILHSLDMYLEQKQIPMLFALCPYTSSKYDPKLPAGVIDYGNDNLDRFMQMVSKYDIDYIDFREEMYKDGMNQYDMMYKTDHHWTTDAGFYAYKKLLKWIEGTTGEKVDEKVRDISNYTRTVYKRWHLGSRGQRTGIYFAGIDDFVLITPDFETSISNGDLEGSFDDVLIDYAPLENREYTSRYTYDFVLGRALGNYINHNTENDLKVLMITDSFGKSVNPYLILSFKEVRSIYDGDSFELTEEYIEEFNPDVVILMYYPDRIMRDDSGFSFGI